MKHTPVAVVCAMLCITPLARAQDNPDESARRALITQAEAAAESGDHARAVELAARAGRIRMTPSLRMMLAVEGESAGAVVDALDAAERCAREADADPALRNREAILTRCRALVSTLGARVGRVTITLRDAPQGAAVRLGGRALDPARWNAATPVAPGVIVIEADAASRRPFRQQIDVTPGATVTIDVQLLPSPEATPTVAAPVRRGAGAGPWILAGAGVLALAGAGVSYWLQTQSVALRDAACDANGCLDLARERQSDAERWNLFTNVGVGVGSAALIGAATWWILARPRATERPRVAWQGHVAPLPGGAMILVGGAL